MRKRVFDISLALLLGLIFALPLLVLIVLSLFNQGRPVFYISERMGRQNKAFDLVKFRTMTVVFEDSGVSGGDKSARITPLGGWLRRYRFDEIPQLWNVLKGDMSFVGPRPPLRQYTEAYPELYDAVLKDRPGITGLATLIFHAHEARILGKAENKEETDRLYRKFCIPRKAQLDLIYQHHQNLCFDIKLLYLTAKRVFTSK